MALIDDYFTRHPKTGQKLDFLQDFYMPFVKSYSNAIKSANPDFLIFFEPVPNESPPIVTPETNDDNYVYAPHWYDLKTMFTKSFDGFVTHDVQGLSRGKNLLESTFFGINGANKNYKRQITNIIQGCLENVGNRPIVIGECIFNLFRWCTNGYQ